MEPDYGLELSKESYKQYCEKPKSPHCSCCPSIDIGKYFMGPDASPVCEKCFKWMMENR